MSVKAKSYINLASTCTGVCRQGQPYVCGWVRFVSLRTNSAERPVNASLCYQFLQIQNKLGWYLIFSKSGIEYL